MKLFGVVLLTLAGAAAGAYGEILSQRRILFYRQVYNLFRFLAEDVALSRLSYPQLIARYQNRPDLPAFLSEMHSLLQSGQTLADAADHAISAACRDLRLTEEICAFLCGVFRQLGAGSLAQEEELLQNAARHMGRILENEEAGRTKSNLLFVKVGAVIGMAFGILMM